MGYNDTVLNSLVNAVGHALLEWPLIRSQLHAGRAAVVERTIEKSLGSSLRHCMRLWIDMYEHTI